MPSAKCRQISSTRPCAPDIVAETADAVELCNASAFSPADAFDTPVLFGYNTNRYFFTVEQKVTRGNTVRFSPNQIAFHYKHPHNTFILVKHRGSCAVKLYEGSRIMELVASGLKLEPSCLGLEACGSWFAKLGA